jgi:LysM repeat protein
MRIQGPPNVQNTGSGQPTYITQQGDTLHSVAQKFEVPLNKLAQANFLSPESHLPAGRELVIPDRVPTPVGTFSTADEILQGGAGFNHLFQPIPNDGLGGIPVPNDGFGAQPVADDNFGAAPIPDDGLGAIPIPNDGLGGQPIPDDGLGALQVSSRFTPVPDDGLPVPDDGVPVPDDNLGAMKISAQKFQSVPNDGHGAVPVPDDGLGGSPVPDDGLGAAPVPNDGLGSEPVPDDGFGALQAFARFAPVPDDGQPVPEDGVPVPDDNLGAMKISAQKFEPVPNDGHGAGPVPDDGLGAIPVPDDGLGAQPVPDDGIGAQSAGKMTRQQLLDASKISGDKN